MITQEYLRKRYNYHPDGYLTYRVRCGRRGLVGNRVGAPNGDGYLCCKINYKSYKVHRLIYIWHYGEIQNVVDHINNNITDNRIENLRDISIGDNNRNKLKTKQNGYVKWYTTEDGRRVRTEEAKRRKNG